MSSMRKPSAAKRQRVDLRRLPYGAGYLIALVVVAVVLYLAYRVRQQRKRRQMDDSSGT